MHTLRRITIALAAACLSACQVAPLNQLISDVFSSDAAPSAKADAGTDKAAAERTPLAKRPATCWCPACRW